MKRFWFLVCVYSGCLMAGCGEEKLTVQDTLKGTWKLTARRLADGSTVKPPEVTGVMEWFAIDDRRAHLTIALTSARDGRTLYDFENDACTLSATGFSMERYLLMGRSYLHGDGPAETDTAVRSVSGGVAVEGKKTTLKIANGVALTFEGSALTVTGPGGFTDTWKKE